MCLCVVRHHHFMSISTNVRENCRPSWPGTCAPPALPPHSWDQRPAPGPGHHLFYGIPLASQRPPPMQHAFLTQEDWNVQDQTLPEGRWGDYHVLCTSPTPPFPHPTAQYMAG